MSHCPLTRSVTSLLFAVVVSTGCGPDPILEAAEALEAEGPAASIAPSAGENPGVPGEPGAVQPGEENMEAGIPEEPAPGIPEEPTPAPAGSAQMPKPPPGGDGVPAEPAPGVPEEPEAAPPGSPGGAAHAGKDDQALESGPQAIIRGVILGEAGVGKVRIDMFDGDQRNVSGPRPKVVGVHELDDVGPFELSVSLSAKRIWLGAYRDGNDNKRPDKGEPFGWYPRNPIYLDDLPARVEVKIESEGKASGLGLDFGE